MVSLISQKPFRGHEKNNLKQCLRSAIDAQGSLSSTSKHIQRIWWWPHTEAWGGRSPSWHPICVSQFLIQFENSVREVSLQTLVCSSAWHLCFQSCKLQTIMQALESEEARAARRKRVAEKLSSYKKQAGLLVDPVAEAAAQDAYRLGRELMRDVSCC